MIQLHLLGPVSITATDAPIAPDLTWRKHLALLIYLACGGSQPRSRAKLADLLWPEGNGARSLNQALVPIRRALGELAVVGDRDSISLVPGSVEIDTDKLAAALHQRRWTEAAALVRGGFCDGFEIKGAPAFEQWMSLQRLQWREPAVTALLRHAGELEEAGQYGKGAEVVGRALELDPLHEPAMLALMRLLVLDDRPAAAVALVDAFAAELTEQTGRAPDARLLTLALRLRARTSVDPVGRGVVATRRPPLVGRAAELATARDCWRHCLSSRTPTLLVIQGDPGCGRTRLADEVAAFAALERAGICRARMVSADRFTPGAAVRTLLHSGLRHAPGAMGAQQATLNRIDDESLEAGALAGCVADLVAAVVEEQPVMLVIDDAHWSDVASIEVLEATLRTVRGPVLLLLAQPRHPPVDHVDRLVTRINRDLAGATITLSPFDTAEVTTLVHQLLPACDPAQQERIARRVLADSAGLPLLVVELLHAVALGLDLRDEGAGWPVPYHTLTDTMPADLPETITAAIRVGFRQLDAPARSALTVVAMAEPPVSRTVIERGTGLAPAMLDIALDQLVWQRWLEGDARGYGCVAEVARQVIARDMITPSQRRQLQERLASHAQKGIERPSR